MEFKIWLWRNLFNIGEKSKIKIKSNNSRFTNKIRQCKFWNMWENIKKKKEKINKPTLREPGKPSDSKIKWENGRKRKREMLENMNTSLHKPEINIKRNIVIPD